MYQLTQEGIDHYWLATEGGMAWMKKWLDWWCIPNQDSASHIAEWCNQAVGSFDQAWAYYDGRYYFKNKEDATMFILKFGAE